MEWLMLLVWFGGVFYIVTRPVDTKDTQSWDWRG